MSDLRIADAPELIAENIEDGLKIPTGGFGNYTITTGTIADWLVRYKDLALKSYVDEELYKKANKSYTDTELYKKADKSFVDSELSKKADRIYVDNELSEKADKSFVEAEIGRLGTASRYDVEDLELIDSQVKTWSGRNQTQKNQDTISPFDYQAKGDGVTDDTQAFLDLEDDYKDKFIDMQGESYKVGNSFCSNIYVNGFWIIGGETIPTNGALVSDTPKEFDVKIACKDDASSLYRMLVGGGRGASRTYQSVCDDGFGNLYTNHNTTIDDSGTSISVINQFPKDSPTISRYSAFALPEDRLGSQGLSNLRLVGEEPTLITSSRGKASGTQYHPDFDYNIDGSYGVVKFKFKNSESGEIDKPIQFRVVEVDKSSTSSTTPTITSDGKWMIIKYSSSGQNDTHFFRVFSTELLRGSADKDISKKYTHEFEINVSRLLNQGDSIHSLSGICSDGAHLYAMLAGWREPPSQPKYLLSCDLLGRDIECVKGDMFNSVSKYSGVNPEFIETEGLSIIEIDGKKQLCAMVLSNPPSHTATGSRFAGVFCLSSKIDRNIVSTDGINIYSGELPYQPFSISVKETTDLLNIEDNKEAYTIDNNGRGTGFLLALNRNGSTRLTVYSSTENTAITAANGNDLVLGAGKTNSDPTTENWAWRIDPQTNLKPHTDLRSTIGASNRKINDIFVRKISYSANVFLTWGDTSPEGVLTGGVGSKVILTTNGDEYIKKSGSGNTGWVLK